MPGTRLDTLKEMVERNPSDRFARYALAMEYRNSGDPDGAVREFRALIEADPDYTAAYFHAGQTLAQRGRTEEARELYSRGIEAAVRKGDRHAGDELQAALDAL
jgi:tetratricopeptide (TPR) repeat protein